MSDVQDLARALSTAARLWQPVTLTWSPSPCSSTPSMASGNTGWLKAMRLLSSANLIDIFFHWKYFSDIVTRTLWTRNINIIIQEQQFHFLCLLYHLMVYGSMSVFFTSKFCYLFYQYSKIYLLYILTTLNWTWKTSENCIEKMAEAGFNPAISR